MVTDENIVILICIFFFIFILFLAGGLMFQYKKNNEACEEAICTIRTQINEYSRDFIKFTDFVNLEKTNNLRIITNNAFIENGVLYPNPSTENHEIIILQDIETLKIQLYLYVDSLEETPVIPYSLYY